MITTPLPSPYQAAIYDWIRTGTGSACVIAVAGSGKTTTLCEAIRHIPYTQSVRLFAFNKQIADTLKARLGMHRNTTCSTFHSSGYRALLDEFHAKVETDRRKVSDLIRENLSETDRRAYGEELVKLVSIAKGLGIGIDGLAADERAVWQGLVDHHDLDFLYLIPPGVKEGDYDAHLLAEKTRVVDLARLLLLESNEAAKVPFEWRIDFDDQLYLPILWDLPLPQYDWVLVDEAQDTNPIQREIIRRSLKPGGRLLAVGDPHQAIYAWRGASHDAVDLIKEDFQATELPLSVCYRCAGAIVKKAQTVVPHIEPAPNVQEGVVDEDAPPSLLPLLAHADAILCRNNAPLVKLAYQLIGEGKPCQIQGRDIGEGLIKLLDKLHPTDLQDGEKRLHDYRSREMARHRKAGNESRAQGVDDRVTCILTILDHLGEEDQSVEGLKRAIADLFGDNQKGLLTLSTIHKAKGLEWPVVAIIGSWLIPSKWATKDWQLQQERNLQYVAWTRAQQRLIVIDDKPEWLRKKERKERGEEIEV